MIRIFFFLFLFLVDRLLVKDIDHTVCTTKESVQRAVEGWYYISYTLFPFVVCHGMAQGLVIVVEQIFHTANSK